MKSIIVKNLVLCLLVIVIQGKVLCADNLENPRESNADAQGGSYPLTSINILLSKKILGDKSHPYQALGDYFEKKGIITLPLKQSMGCGVEFQYIEMNDPKATFTIVSCSTGVQIIAYSAEGVRKLIRWLDANTARDGKLGKIPYGVHSCCK